METVTVLESVCIDGEWFAAHWAVQAVDGGTGEVLITAATPGQALVLRMDMGLAADLRRMAGFVERPAPDGSRVLGYDVAHECNGVRLATIERRQEEDAATFGEHVRRILALETAMRGEHRTMHATFNEHQARLQKLEDAMRAVIADGLVDRQQLHAIANRVDALEVEG